MTPRQRMMLMVPVLLVAAWLSLFGDKTPVAEVAAPTARSGDQTPASKITVAEPSANVEIAEDVVAAPGEVLRLAKRNPTPHAAVPDVFAANLPPPPPPQQNQQQQAPPPPPNPYAYIGRKLDEGRWSYFFEGADGHTFVVEPGGKLASYQLVALNYSEIALVDPSTKVRHIIRIDRE